jgi:uncharacterized protein (TIGR02594 family)
MKKYMIGLVSSIILAGISSANAANIKFNSKEEIIEFQKSHHLIPDGIVGKKTRAAARRDGDKIVTKLDPKTENKVASEPCHALFVFEVPCENNVVIDEPRNSLPVPAPTPPVRRALQLTGLDSRRDRAALKNYIGADPRSMAWCAAFANAVLAETGYQTTDSYLARSFLNYGIATKTPKQGDLVILKRDHSNWAGHVGFYIQTVEIEGIKYVAVLGGNQNKGINVAYFPVSNVLGYREPVQG